MSEVIFKVATVADADTLAQRLLERGFDVDGTKSFLRGQVYPHTVRGEGDLQGQPHHAFVNEITAGLNVEEQDVWAGN